MTHDAIRSIEWIDGKVRFIDQTKLPAEEIFVETGDPEILADAIRTLKVRGAPALGIAAAYAVVLATQRSPSKTSNELFTVMERAADVIARTRPTAKNLFWALERMRSACRLNLHKGVGEVKAALLHEALAIHREDVEMCTAIGSHGSALIPNAATVLTHCNTGALATGGEGTAQSIITTAVRVGKNVSVYADETRPLLQGSRLTAWELQKHGIPVTVIADNTAAFVMAQGKIDLVLVGADRIAANGDVANKVGTYNVAVIAKEHGIPFYVAAPSSTIDPATSDGSRIPIEERDPRELTEWMGKRTAPEGVDVYTPAFDITPHAFITAIVTERGILYPPFGESIRSAFRHIAVQTA
ncbi:MAG TPA: S-methyl-5-thioribose-1-phosphate isomerase [Bacteroidota bacterium]|nr:S-methyl-5-thioribose-1-phosphate isomerase [Bacteroidota bacterium]